MTQQTFIMKMLPDIQFKVFPPLFIVCRNFEVFTKLPVSMSSLWGHKGKAFVKAFVKFS